MSSIFERCTDLELFDGLKLICQEIEDLKKRLDKLEKIKKEVPALLFADIQDFYNEK